MHVKFPVPRTVLDPYADLFTVPGTRAFSSAGLLARVPMSTAGLGSVLLVQGESGSYALAGAVSGTLALSFAVGSPQWARAMDRRGQGPVLRATAVLSLVVGLAYVVAVVSDAPHWTWFALAALCGAHRGQRRLRRPQPVGQRAARARASGRPRSRSSRWPTRSSSSSPRPRSPSSPR